MEEKKRMSYSSIYEIRQKISLSQKLVKKRPEFRTYAGASPAISEQIALIKSAIKHGIITRKEDKQLLKMYVDFLKEKNKALFAATVGELSKLSFYYGLPSNVIDAT